MVFGIYELTATDIVIYNLDHAYDKRVDNLKFSGNTTAILKSSFRYLYIHFLISISTHNDG